MIQQTTYFIGAYENASTTVQGWKMQVRKKQVQMCKDGKCIFQYLQFQRPHFITFKPNIIRCNQLQADNG